MRPRWLGFEVAALAAAAAGAWVLARTGTAAWLARVEALGLRGPEAAVAESAATRASIWFTVGIAVLVAARIVGRRLRRSRDDDASIAAPWLLPAMVGASLLGLVVHVSTVEVQRGAALLPTASAFAQGFAIACVCAAPILAAPIDLAELVTRARLIVAGLIAAIFVALAVAGSGPPGSGTRINLGPIQPIELVKPLVIVFLAAYLGARAGKLRWHRRRVLGMRWPRVELLVPAIGVLLGIIGGLFVIGDLGPVLLLAIVFLGMFFVASRATGWVVVAFAILAGTLSLLALAPGLAGGGTVRTRLVMWTDPWTNAMSNGHQLGEGLWALAAGGWTGQGLAQAATPLVPAGKTDLVLVTLTEQLGVRGLLAYQLVLGALVLGTLVVAARSRTAQRVLIASGVGVLFVAQWMVILGGTLGYLPLTGIVVPFVSTGRSSMIVFVVLVALVARLADDGRMRVTSTELDELHAAVRGVGLAAAIAIAVMTVGAVRAALASDVSARGIRVRLGDGTLVTRTNPRLVVIANKIRRGSILDRDGTPLAISEAPGVRTYPLGDALGTLLGVAPSRVLLPPWALERVLDDDLRGYADLGAFVPLLELPPSQRAQEVAKIDADVASRSVRTTLDAELQRKVAALARDAVAKGGHRAAAAVVLDVDTGQVLARVQVPDYDPGAPAWQDKAISADPSFRGAYGAWPDKTGVQGMFQSGSVAKLFTALAAVRAGASRTRFECRERDAQGPLFTRPGWPKPIHDHSGDAPHGQPDLASAIAASCNVYFGQLGLALGPEPLVALRRDGVAIGYGDELVPGAAGTRQLASTAFGQGAMVLNVVQAARLVAAIASGGRYRTCSLRLDATCDERPIVDGPDGLRPIIAGMRRVMTDGTGARLSELAGVRVYGKTGTADVHGFAGEEPYGIARGAAARPHSWFVAFGESSATPELAPTATGRLAVAVVVPRGGTGASAAGPLAMKILAAARELGYLQ